MVTHNELNHNVRNAILGVVLELKAIQRAVQRMGKHLDRIEEVCTDSATEAEND